MEGKKKQEIYGERRQKNKHQDNQRRNDQKMVSESEGSAFFRLISWFFENNYLTFLNPQVVFSPTIKKHNDPLKGKQSL